MGLLRTLFAISVVFDHLPSNKGDLLVGGRLAVQLFYVVSGFLISYVLTSTDNYKDSLGKFYLNRALRLYPIYFVVAGLTLLAHLFGSGAFFKFYEGLPNDASMFLILSNLFIFGQDWLMFFGIQHADLTFTGSFANSEVPLYQGLLVPQAWTLGVELTFYLVAPFIMHSPRRLFALLAASLLLRVGLIASGVGLTDPWTYRFFPTELALFLMGALSQRYLLPLCQSLCQRLRYLPELATVCLLAYTFVHTSIPINHNVRDGATVLLFAFFLPMTFIFQSRYRFDRKIGELSYPIYICHMLVIMFLHRFGNGMDIDRPALFTALTVGFSIGLAIVLNWLIGSKVESWRKQVRTGTDLHRPAGHLAPSPAASNTRTAL